MNAYRRIMNKAAIAACVVGFSACTAENVLGPLELPGQTLEEGLVEKSFTAVLAEGQFGTLRKNEQVAVFDGTAKRVFTVESVTDGKALLTGAVAEDSEEYHVVYPYASASDVVEENGIPRIEIPAIQTIAEGDSLSVEASVSYGKADETGNVVLESSVSYIKIAVPEGVTSVRLYGSCYENLVDGKETIVLRPSGETFEAGNYYAAVLPVELPEGYRVMFDKDAEVAVSEVAGPVSFAQGTVTIADIAAPAWIPTVIENEEQLRNYFTNQGLFGTTEVKLGQDITLESSWTPVRLLGRLNGQGYKISGVNVSTSGNVGFFSVVEENALVRNLTIEGTINASRPSTAAKSFVGVAGIVYGTMENVTSRADITLAEDVAWSSLIGGIAGNVLSGGVLSRCVNMGTITTTGSAGGESWYIGGIVGYIGDPSNAGWSNNNAGGIISSCVNEGTLTVDNSNVEAIGGVVGMFRGGSMQNCENKGSFVVGKTKSGYLGGIVGYVQNRSDRTVTISGCVNNALIDLTSDATILSSVGGIIGMAHRQPNGTEVSGCYNKQPISVSSTGSLNIGGIVATYGGSGAAPFKFTKCHNQAAVSCVNLASATAFLDVATRIGGIAGNVGGVTNFDSCTNSGAVSSDRLSRNYVGGIVAYAGGTTEVLSSTNSGTVTANPSNSVVTADYVGGIVAYATGTLTMTSNTNAATGSVGLVAQSKDGYRSAAGGVVGYTDAVSHTMTGNINRAAVLSDCPNIYTPAGGVIGLVRGNLTMRENINFGDVTASSTSSSDAVIAGGIVGLFDMKGAKDATDNKVATLTGDKTFGHIKSQYSVGMLFGIYAWDCYGKVTVNNCVVGGRISGKRPVCDETVLKTGNYSKFLSSWIRSGSSNTTLFQSNTVIGVAENYDK